MKRNELQYIWDHQSVKMADYCWRSPVFAWNPNFSVHIPMYGPLILDQIIGDTPNNNIEGVIITLW